MTPRNAAGVVSFFDAKAKSPQEIEEGTGADLSGQKHQFTAWTSHRRDHLGRARLWSGNEAERLCENPMKAPWWRSCPERPADWTPRGITASLNFLALVCATHI